MIYKIVYTTNEIPLEILELFQGKLHRAQEYYSSRLALLEALRELGINAQFDELEIVDHHHLKKWPHILVSLSHSKGIGAALVERLGKITSVGIDLELASRSFNSETSKFFLNSFDENSESLLHLWTKKEAAYKTYSATGKNLLLKDIWINGKNEFGVERANVDGQVSLVEKDGLLIALAIGQA